MKLDVSTSAPRTTAAGIRIRFACVSAFVVGLTVLGLVCGPTWRALAQEKAEAKKPKQEPAAEDSVDRDYAAELPRIAPTEIDKAMKTFHVADGFRLELAAAEPLVVDPVAMAFDENGRLYVVEMRDYSEDDALRLGRIRRLEDTDDDGRFDRSTVFAEDLAWPTALCCFDGGLFVGAAPDIFYLKDEDGDGKADVSRVVFTGFGKSNVQGLINSFHWGLDNRIHGATSSSGASVTRPDAPDQPPLVLRGRDFAFEPRTLVMEATSGGAQHGMSFDPWGNKFVCSNSDHVQLVMYEDRYAARNPYAAAPSSRRSIAVDGPQADVFRTSPVEPWRILRTRLRLKQVVPGPVEGGGRAAGYFTSATGVTIYAGDAWPREAYGWAIVGDVGGNLVHRKQLSPDGVGLTATRIDEKSEFVTSDDIWFRPVQFANAPDGTLYVLDMYREVIEHPASLHPVIKKHLDLTSGRDRGRIYRIVPTTYARRATPKLSEATTAQLVAALGHANGWHRTTAARLLYERQDAAALRGLEQLATTGAQPEGRMAALYALQGLKLLTPAVTLAAMDDAHPQVRRHAVIVAEPQLADSPALRAKLIAMVDDGQLVVRYQVAFSLGAISGSARDAALARLVLRDGADPYVRFAVHSALANGAGAVLSRLAGDAEAARSNAGKQMIQLLAAQIGRQQSGEDVAVLLRLLPQLKDAATTQLILTSLAAPPDSPLATQIAAATGGRSNEILAGMLAEARRVAADQEQPAAQRAEHVFRLQLGRFETESELFQRLLSPDQPAEVQQAVVRTMGSFEDREVAKLLIDAWPALSPSLRQRAGDLFLSRPGWTEDWLRGVEAKHIPAGDIAPGHWQSLTTHADPGIRERAAKLAQAARGNRQEVLQRYQVALEMEGDVARGAQVFKKSCSTCHQAAGVGHAIGPNLAAMRNRGPEAILSNVLAPNAEVNPQFISYIVVTKDGRSINGVIAEETASGVTLQRAENARDHVLRIDIDEMRSTGLSLMPEGLERDIDVQAMADLLAYLKVLE